jgi:outer membrane receptor protein involved in Fe transport
MILNRRPFRARRGALAVFVLYFPFVGASSALAQGSRVGATLEGTVSDSSAAVMPQVTITLRNSLTNQPRTLTTDVQGLFRADQVAVGTYEVRVEHPGFTAQIFTGINLNLGQTIHLDVILTPAATSAEISVTAQPSAIDTSQTSIVSSVDQERIEELPVRSRNYLDFVLLAPGVSSTPTKSPTSSSTSSSGSGFTFGGLRSRSNNVSIDGLDNNDEYLGSSRIELSPEIVQEFQVVNNGLSAESGGASGGSINVITRSGTNTIHGDAFLFAQDGGFNARDPFEIEANKPSLRRYRTGFAVGGPIAKGRTFYYAAAEQEHNRSQIGSDIDPAVGSTINSFLAMGALPSLATRRITTDLSPTARAETEAAGKLDHQPTKDMALMLRYAFTNNKESGDAFNTNGLVDASARGSTFTSDNTLSGSLTTLLGAAAVSDLRFQVATRHAVFRTNEAFGPEMDIAGMLTFGHPYGGNTERRENHYEADYTYSRTQGEHLWKVGGTVNRVRLRARLPDGFDGVYLFSSVANFLAANPDQFRQAFGNPDVNFPVTSAGGFIQDHWSITRRFTADMGVRYDFERLPTGFNQDTNNFSPRIGLAWNPSPAWVFRAGYGIFFDRYVLADLARAIEKNGSQAFEEVGDASTAANLFVSAQGGSLSIPSPGLARSIFRPDPHQATPYSQQSSVGAEYLLSTNLTLRADYMFVRGVKLSQTLNVNLLPPVVLTLANASSLGIPSPTAQQIGREVFSQTRSNPQFGDIYQLQDSASSTYSGVSFTLNRRMNDELAFSGSYTLSKTMDNASDFDEQPENPFNLAAENSVSRQNQRQRFVFNGLWELPIGDEDDKSANSSGRAGWLTQTLSHIEIAPIFTAESGHPVNPLTGLDSNRSHAYPLSGRPLSLGRNSFVTPANVTMDFRFLKYFPFSASKHLDLVAEFFNLFNHANAAQINPVFGSSTTPQAGFGHAIEGTGARQVQFSLDLEF